MKKSIGVAMLALITMSILMVHPSEAIGCNELASMLLPCLNYLRSGGSPGTPCCAGAKKVEVATRSQADRQTACKCAKSAAGQFNIKVDAASSLPSKCGISTNNIPMNPNVNCNTIP